MKRKIVLNYGLVLMVAFGVAGCQSHSMDTSFTDNPGPVASDPAHSETIVLREGDIIDISLPGSPNLNAEQTIRRDGKISLELVGDVTAAGLTISELQQNLIKLYAPQVSSKEVTVMLKSSSFPVFVSGYVVRPGKIMSDHPITALEAIMEAGGFDEDKSNMKAVKVIRIEKGKSKTYILNLKKVLDGKDNNLFYLKPGDIIEVPERLQWF